MINAALNSDLRQQIGKMSWCSGQGQATTIALAGTPSVCPTMKRPFTCIALSHGTLQINFIGSVYMQFCHTLLQLHLHSPTYIATFPINCQRRIHREREIESDHPVLLKWWKSFCYGHIITVVNCAVYRKVYFIFYSKNKHAWIIFKLLNNTVIAYLSSKINNFIDCGITRWRKLYVYMDNENN